MQVRMLKRLPELQSLLLLLQPLLLLPLLLLQLLQHQQHQHLLKPLLRRLPLLQLLPRSEDNNEGNNKKCSSVI